MCDVISGARFSFRFGDKWTELCKSLRVEPCTLVGSIILVEIVECLQAFVLNLISIFVIA